MKIIVASKNPVKLNAVCEAFSRYFSDLEVMGFEAESGVSHTPQNEDIYRGASNRAALAKSNYSIQHPDAKYFVGLEAGIVNDGEKWFLSNRACIMGPNKTSSGTSAQYEIPEYISKRLLQGMELGDVMDSLIKDTNTKQKGGAVEFISKGIVNRKDLSVQAVLMALFPHINSELYDMK